MANTKSCSRCGEVKPSSKFYKDPRAKSGLRSRCIECLTNGLPPGPKPVSLFDRYVKDKNGCWIWQGYIGPHGYGGVRFQGRSIMAHRASYILTNGEIPEDAVIDHLCSVKSCINPSHLEAVSHRLNIQRAWNRNHCKSCDCGPPPSPTKKSKRQPRGIEEKVEWLMTNHEVLPNGCHLWIGGLRKDGYGRVKWKNSSTVAHRVVYETMNGLISSGTVIDHKCSNRYCVNPDHLEPVTYSENTQRAWNRNHCATCTCNEESIGV